MPNSIDMLITALARCRAACDYTQALSASNIFIDERALPPAVEQAPIGLHRLHQTAAYELVVCTWGARQESAIHGHGNSFCVLKVCRGELLEFRYKVRENSLDQRFQYIDQEVLRAGEAVVMHAVGMAHKIVNCNDSDTMSMHLYVPPLCAEGHVDTLFQSRSDTAFKARR